MTYYTTKIIELPGPYLRQRCVLATEPIVRDDVAIVKVFY